jgi:hypothetical protein
MDAASPASNPKATVSKPKTVTQCCIFARIAVKGEVKRLKCESAPTDLPDLQAKDVAAGAFEFWGLSSDSGSSAVS